MDIKLVEYDTVFLKKSREWLSDAEIKQLTMTPNIDRWEQKKWFEGLKNRKDYLVKGIVADERPIGAVGLKHIDFENRTAEYFGYIGEKEYWGKGIGAFMMRSIESAAKEHGIREVYLKVLKDNDRAINLYKKNGYEYLQGGEIIRMKKNI